MSYQYMKYKDEIEKYLHGAYYEMSTGKRSIVHQYYGEEDFLQDIRLRVHQELTKGKLEIANIKLSTLIKNLTNWHWLGLFSENHYKRPVKRSQDFIVLSSALGQDEDNNALSESIESLAGTTEPDFVFNTDISKIYKLIGEVIPVKHHFVIEYFKSEYTTAKTLAEKIGTSHQYVTKMVRYYKELLVDYLSKHGYNRLDIKQLNYVQL